jgi:putative alpha-1,2-mannosidase
MDMKIITKLALIAALLIISAQGAPNLHIGTGGFGYGCGSNSPAAQVPFSFVRLGPDTSPIIKK